MKILLSLIAVAFTAGAAELPHSDHPFFGEPLVLGLHRGGALAWPENTVYAYQQAAQRWPKALLEADVRPTKDGLLVLMHDGTVDRTTDGTGRLSELSFDAVRKLDAGYRFTPDGGATFPHRGKGLQVPTLEEALQAAPNHRFLLELKGGDEAADDFVREIREAGAAERVLIASFNPRIMDAVRRAAPELLTCYDMNTGRLLLGALRSDGWDAYTPVARVLSVTEELHRQFAVTGEEVAAIQAKGIVYQLHTLNTREKMEAALRQGIQSILTDDPVLLEDVLQARSLQEGDAGVAGESEAE